MPFAAGSMGLQDMYRSESEAIRHRFDDSCNGQLAIRERSDLIDTVLGGLWRSEIGPAQSEGLCVVALGGYGRRALFPHSDVDLLFLSESAPGEHSHKVAIRKLCQALWDLHLRVSPAARTLDECGKLHRDNLEFNISLLDRRYICGNGELFEQLQSQVILRIVAREALEMQQRLTDLTRARHNKYGHTIFHLEPNIKECPGGMRDYQVACWLSLIAEMEKTRVWPPPENLLPSELRRECTAAVNFLSAVRCFLHYRQGRDLNGLTYELQSEAAAAGIGFAARSPLSPEEWMRGYFRHVRSIYRLSVLLDEVPPVRFGLYRFFQNRKSRLSNADFSVVEGRVFLRQLSSAEDVSVVLNLFEFVARHGLRLSAETERCVAAALPRIEPWARGAPDLWAQFRRILVLPHAGAALRAMHRLGLLILLFPEFQAIDSLVIRDYYHRYTVDEHSFVAIENLHALRKPGSDLERRFRDILDGIERPELLFLALLFHDVGKWMSAEDHVASSLEALQHISQRLRLEPADREIVSFLIASHLRMSATVMRRDIFDPKVVQDFSDATWTTERLKLLTLLTYADLKAVNPEALTPWKAEMLWQLYAAAFNHLSRTVDDQRLDVDASHEHHLTEVVSLASRDFDPQHLLSFLAGFPKRYLLTHSPGEIVSHCQMHECMKGNEPQIDVVRRDGYFELVLLTIDRPALLAAVVGTLAFWGMNILKAEAFANGAGTVLDTFRFSDRFRTLDLNPTELQRFKRSLSDAISGEINVSELMQTKFKPVAQRPKVKIEPQIYVDDTCSAHSTLIEITAQDRPGLLYDISSTLAELGCNIEVAIIDTQGQTAIDVFYVTRAGCKLAPQDRSTLRTALLPQL